METAGEGFPREEARVDEELHLATKDKDEMIEAIDPGWKGQMPYTLIVDEKGDVIYREMGASTFSRCAAPSCRR